MLVDQGFREAPDRSYLPLRVEAVTSYGGAQRLVEVADHVDLRAQDRDPALGRARD